MPIYEFYCQDCHRIYSFLARVARASQSPSCPRCGRAALERRVSPFAISKSRAEPASAAPEPSVDESRLEQAMQSLTSEAEGLDEDNPRQAAQLMRKLFGAAGLPVGSGMQEALRRMEAGEDPEKVEAELGDALDTDPFSAEPKPNLRQLRRALLPPEVDPNLYEM